LLDPSSPVLTILLVTSTTRLLPLLTQFSNDS
jgi:hypothetical protein